MAPAGKKAKHLSSVNNNTKAIHHHHQNLVEHTTTTVKFRFFAEFTVKPRQPEVLR